jgi:hypothetical protein
MKKIILLLIIFTSTACFNYKELEDLSVITNIGIDKDNEKYTIILKEMSAYKGEDTSDINTFYYSETCKKLSTCFKNIKNKTTKEIYYNTVQNIIIDKESFLLILYQIMDIFKGDVLIFVTDENITKLLESNDDYKYINELVKNPKNSIFKIKKYIVGKENFEIPILKFSDKTAILDKKSLKVRQIR